jgi:allophanate hydrolase
MPSNDEMPDSLVIADLRRGYLAGRFGAREVIEQIMSRADEAPEHHLWITRLSRERVMDYVSALKGHSIESLPLYGIPFVIKDNIDLAGVPTTAACPAFAYTPEDSAPVVQKLLNAGAIPLGKTNLDQFPMGPAATASTVTTFREARAPVPPSPWPWAWRAFPSAPTRPDRGGYPPRSTISSGSNPASGA